MSKLLEKCAFFDQHLTDVEFLPSYQSAYRSKLHIDILTAMEHKKVTAFVGLDLSAAFDTVYNSSLLTTFQNMYGVKDKALSCMRTK